MPRTLFPVEGLLGKGLGKYFNQPLPYSESQMIKELGSKRIADRTTELFEDKTVAHLIEEEKMILDQAGNIGKKIAEQKAELENLEKEKNEINTMAADIKKRIYKYLHKKYNHKALEASGIGLRKDKNGEKNKLDGNYVIIPKEILNYVIEEAKLDIIPVHESTKKFEDNSRIDAVEKKIDEIYTMLERLYQEKQSKNPDETLN